MLCTAAFAVPLIVCVNALVVCAHTTCEWAQVSNEERCVWCAVRCTLICSMLAMPMQKPNTPPSVIMPQKKGENCRWCMQRVSLASRVWDKQQKLALRLSPSVHTLTSRSERARISSTSPKTMMRGRKRMQALMLL